VNRQRLAELLGFDSAIVNTRDAMWQVDTPVELASLVTMLFLHLDRLAEDLQIWNTAEFDLAELADRHARISLIMPQKKNPYSLAFVRGMTGHLLGKMVSFAAVGKTPSAQMDNRIFIIGETPRMLDHAIETVRLMAGVIDGLSFNTDLMAHRAGEGYAQATDLAEVIMTHAGLNYRTAHRIVGLAIRLALERHEQVGTIPSELLDEAAQHVIGQPLALSPQMLHELNDPRTIVATRQGLGGAAEEPVGVMLSQCRTHLHAAHRWRHTVAEKLDSSEKNLLELATTFASAQ
jgi:argininosuccinate lyase